MVAASPSRPHRRPRHAARRRNRIRRDPAHPGNSRQGLSPGHGIRRWVHESVSAGQQWGNAPPQAEIVVATGVAANTARADLAGMVTAEKAARGISAGRNGAVFEFRIAEGGWDHVIAFSQRSVGHAERIGARELQARGVSPDAVTRIYSQLEPCAMPGGYCLNFLIKTHPKAEVSWTYPYPANDAAVRAASVAAMRGGG